eukprot:3109059-Pleurochrysis_carterae.AAC.1
MWASQSEEHRDPDNPPPSPVHSCHTLLRAEQCGCGARSDSEDRALCSSESSLSLQKPPVVSETAGHSAPLGSLRSPALF